jgi:hypothetical protein
VISALYRGELMHARADHLAKRVFRYPVYMAALELAELPALDRTLRLFSHNRANLYALRDADYTTPLPTDGTLVTNLRVAGYVFNPVSFFLAPAREHVIAEVNNTYGGRHCYALGAAERQPDRRGRVGFRAVRELFVSPFLHGPASYEFWFDCAPGAARWTIEMFVEQPLAARPRAAFSSVQAQPASAPASRSKVGAGLPAPTARTFTARFTGERVELTDRALLAAAVRYPLMTAQVIALIHYEAVKLRLLGVPYRTPGPDHKPLDV